LDAEKRRDEDTSARPVLGEDKKALRLSDGNVKHLPAVEKTSKTLGNGPL